MASRDERFALMFRSHYRHIYAYCGRRVEADQTDDLTADVFLTVWRRINDAPDDESAMLPWLYRIAYLTLSNHWRGLRRKKALHEKLVAQGLHVFESLPDLVIARQQVREALALLASLRPADQEIIKLSIWEQLSHKEIAAVIDSTPEGARQRLHRARKRLAQAYQQRLQRDPLALGKEVTGDL